MKRSLQHTAVLSLGLLMLGSYTPVFGGEPGFDITIRNALAQPVQVEIGNREFLHIVEDSTVYSRREVTLKDVNTEERSDQPGLGVQVHTMGVWKDGPVITRCQTTLTKSMANPRIAVIIHQLKDSDSPRCDIVDLNALQSTASAPSRDTFARRMSMDN